MSTQIVYENGQPAPPPTEEGGVDEFVDFHDKLVQFKFKRLSERRPGESWINLIYGSSKTGKTYFAGTAGPRTLFVNVGHGIDTLLSPAFTTKYPESKDMIVVDINEKNPKGQAEAFDMVTDVIDHAMKFFPDKFENVILDEATAFRKFAINKATELNTASRTKTTRANRMEEYLKIDIQDYQEEMNMIEWFLGQYIPIFKGANKHFLMLAHERQVFTKPSKPGEEQSLSRIIPGFTGKTFPDKVPAFFDDVMHSEVSIDAGGNAIYRLRTAGNNLELGGTRHGGIFNVLELNPNFQQMLAKIKAAQPKQSTKR